MKQEVNYGLIIKELVKQHKLNAIDAATAFGYDSRQGFERVLKQKDVSTAVLKKACEVFKLDMSYFLTDSRSYTNNSHNKMVNEGSNVAYGSGNTAISGKANDADLLLLKQENDSLKREMTLLREMVDMLKATQGMKPRKEEQKDVDPNNFIMNSGSEGYLIKDK